jgi:hypothetical protein
MRRFKTYTCDLWKGIRISAELGQAIGDGREVWKVGEEGRSV